MGEAKFSLEGWVGMLYGSVGVRWFAVNILYGLVHWFAFLVMSGVEVASNWAEIVFKGRERHQSLRDNHDRAGNLDNKTTTDPKY